MTTTTAVLLGAWIFAAACALAPRVSGWFTLLAFLIALLMSFCCR